MTYSVWDPVAKAYDYFVTPQGRQLEQDVPRPRHLSVGGTDIGISPDQAAWPLPAGAKKVGRGATAKGMIARRGGGAALGDATVNGIGFGTFAIAGVLLFLALRR